MPHRRPSDDQLTRTFAAVLEEVLSGQGIRTHTGLDQDTEDALWELATYGPGAPADLVDAARAAFAGQLDGSNAERRHAQFMAKIAAREQSAAARTAGPTATAAADDQLSADLFQTVTAAQVMRINGGQTHLDEDGRTCHEGELFTGEVEKRADNGQLESLTTYYLGIEHGLQQQWWPDGTLRARGVTNMGVAVGQWRYWHANGNLSESVMLGANGREITRKQWNAAGEVTLHQVTRGR